MKRINIRIEIPSWKSLCMTILVLCISPIIVQAQNEAAKADTLYSSQDTTLQYLNSWEYAFMMHEETKWIFKGFLNERAGRTYAKIGFETKLTSSFTINIEGGSDVFFL